MPVSFDGDFGSLLNGLDRSLSGVGKVLGGTLQAAAATAGAGIAAVLGGALTSGFGRLVAIDDARSKLLALGQSGEDVDSIMKTVTASVKGTSFGLGEAATAAASAIAAGIKPGKELQRSLKQIGALATVTGGDFNDLAAIYNEVAATGRVTGDTLNQLAERGSDVQKRLAEFFGVTQEEVREMASQGKISFKDFQNALGGLEDAAKKAGGSFSATFANLRASLSRIGANLLKPIFDQLGGFDGVFARITKALGPVEDRAAEVGQVLGQAFTAGIDAIERLGKAIGPVWDRLGSSGQIAVIVGGIAASFGALAATIGSLIPGLAPLLSGLPSLTSILGGLAGAARFLLGPIGLIGGALFAAWQESEPFRESVGKLGETLQRAGRTMMPYFISAGETISEELLPRLSELFESVGRNVGDFLAELEPLISKLIDEFAPIVGDVIDKLVELAPKIVDVATKLTDTLGPPLTDLAETVIPKLLPLVEKLADLFGEVLPPALDNASTNLDNISVALQRLAPVVEDSMAAAGESFGGFTRSLQGAETFVSGFASGNWAMAWQGIQEVVAGAVDALKANWGGWIIFFQTSVGPAVEQARVTLETKFNEIVSGALQFGLDLVAAVREAFAALTGSVSAAMTAVQTAITTRWFAILSGVVQFGIDLVAAVQQAFAALTGAVSGAMTGVATTITVGWSRIINGAVQFGAGLVRTIQQAFSQMVAAGANAVAQFRSRVQNGFSNVARAASQFGSNLVRTIQQAMSRMLSTAQSVLSRLPGVASRAFNSALSTARSIVSRLPGVVGQAASRAVSSLGNALSRAPGVVSRAFNSAVSVARSALSRLVSAVQSGISRAVGVLSTLPGRARSAVGGVAGALFGAGVQLINGLIGGIRAAAGRVASAARSVVQNAINAARSALGIASPSKVFMEIGKNTGEGMAIGLAGTRDLVQSAADRALVPSISGAVGGSSANVARSRRPGDDDAAAGATVVNLNEYGPRTDSAKRREIDWQLAHPTRGRTFQSGALAIP